MMRRLVAALNRVPPLWWARFVFLALIVAVLCVAQSFYLTMRAASREGEAKALAEYYRAKLKGYADKRCVLYRPGIDEVRVFRGPLQ